LRNQHGQVLAVEAPALGEAAILVAAGVSGVLLAAAHALRRFSMVAVFEQHRLSGGHTLPAEV
jgi:predicted NAD/FAD-binding protein